VVGLDPRSPNAGLRLLREVREKHGDLCLIGVSSAPSEQLVLLAFRAGATDYLPHPACGQELIERVLRHCGDTGAEASGDSLVGESDEMMQIRASIENVAASDSNVLITGETGTGKELVARLIHGRSARAGKPLVCINCAAIPDSLFESELFGYERGAFTGAHASTPGKMEAGNGGTVFLDEIGELSPYAQVRLLRVLEEKSIQRLGARKPIALNIRVVVATNRDLDRLAMEDKFRRDLYFRLNVGRIHMPRLRDRKSDIPILVNYYLTELNRQFGSHVEGVQPEVMETLLTYEWPGNIRELRNLLEAVFISRPKSQITVVDLPSWFHNRHPGHSVRPSEQDRLLTALYATNWNKSKAAGQLKWSRMTLYRKLAKYGLDRNPQSDL